MYAISPRDVQHNSPTPIKTPQQNTSSLRRALILTGGIVPALIATTSHAATITWDAIIGPEETLNTDPTFGEGLREGFLSGGANFNDPNPGNGPNSGISLDLRMGQDKTFGPTQWQDNRTWVYTGQVFTGPNGIISFAANTDDTDFLMINGVNYINDVINSWNTTVATTVTGLTPNTWVSFEYRTGNFGGGAGPSGENSGGASNWNSTTGAVMSHNNEGGSLNALDYDLGKPAETPGGDPTLFRYEILPGGDDIKIADSSTVTLQGTGSKILENSITVEVATSTLTINNIDSTVRTLGSLTTTLASTASGGNGTSLSITGSSNFETGALNDGGFTGVQLIKAGGTGDLILNNATNDVDGLTLSISGGRVVLQAPNSGQNPLSSMTNAIQMTGTTAVLNVSTANNGTTTFGNSLNVTESSALQHTANSTDTIIGSVNITAGKTLTVDATAGTLNLSGGVNTGSITKNGNGLLTIGGTSNFNTLTVNNGRVNLLGNATLANSPVMGSGTILSLRGTANVTAPSGFATSTGNTLEIYGGGAGTTNVNLNSGGQVNLSGPIGLEGHFYNGDNVGANGNFGNYTSFSNYFTGRGAPALQNLTTANGVLNMTFNADGDGDAPFSVYGFNAADDIVIRMKGFIYIPASGTYTFGTTSDDGSMLFINPGSGFQTVVNNNFFQGMIRRAGSITLKQGIYPIEMGFYEGGGGAGFVADWAGPGFGQQAIPNAFLFSTNTVANHTSPLNLNANGTINADWFSSVFSQVNAAPGVTTTINGNQITATNLALAGAGAYTFDTTGQFTSLTANTINDGGAAVTINKNGPGLLILDNTTSAQLTNVGSVININGGTLAAVLGGGGFTPTGNAVLNFNGGGLVISSKGGNKSVALPASFGGANPIISAQQIATGVDGPININLTGNLNVGAGQTLSLSTQDDYTLSVGGTAGGNGTVSVNGGRVETTSNAALQGLNVTFGGSGSRVLNLRSASPVLNSLTGGDAQAQLALGDGTNPTTLVYNNTGTQIFSGAIVNNGSSAGSLVKNGSGTLNLPGIGHNYSGGLTINSGTVIANGSSVGSGTITLSGGILEAQPNGLLGEYWGPGQGGDGGAQAGFSGDLAQFNAYFAGKGAPAVSALTTTGGRTNLKFSTGGGIDGGGTESDPFGDQGFTEVNNMVVRFSGTFYAPVAGTYTFLTRSDDGSVLFINGTKVVDNNNYQGLTNVSGNITLAAGPHNIAVGFYEGGGGAGFEVRYTPPGGSDQFITNDLLGGLQGTNPVNVTANSTINPVGGTTSLGALTLNNSVTLNVGNGDLNVPSTSLSGSGGTFSINKAAGNANLGAVTSTGAVTLNKAGLGSAVISGGSTFASGSNINVNQGSITALEASALGSATANLANGTELRLSSVGGDQNYNVNFTAAGTATLSAGRFGVGAAGPLNVNLNQPIVVSGGSTLNLASQDNYNFVANGTVTGAGTLTVPSGNVVFNANVSPATLNINGSVSTVNSSDIGASVTNVNNGGLLVLNPGASNTRTAGNVQIGGGVLRAISGITDLGSNSITGTAETTTVNQLNGRLHIGGPDFSGSVYPADTNAGILGVQLTPPTRQATLTGPLSFGPLFGADGAFATFFNDTRTSTNVFTASFFGKLTVPSGQGGTWSFQSSLNDDSAGFWVDLNHNGLFETNGSAGNELISGAGACCDSGPVGTANLIAGRTYNVAMAVEDTGGGSSLESRFARPGDSLTVVNPSNVGQAGLWSTANASTGGGIVIEANSEIRASRANQVHGIALTGNNAILRLNSGSSVTDNVQSLTVIGATTTVDIGVNNNIIAEHLSIAPNATLNKNGAGSLTVTASQSFGNNGIFNINGGSVTLQGTLVASNGTANNGRVVVNNTGTLNLAGSITGVVDVNSGGTLGGTGSSGLVTVNSGGLFGPGNSPGTYNAAGLTVHDGGTLGIELASTSSHDIINVTGAVTLLDSGFGDVTGGTLNLSLLGGFSSIPGDVFGIVRNDGSDAIVGTFAGLAEGGTITVGAYQFSISYVANLDGGGVGNDIALTTVVPEPGAVAMLLGGFATLIGLQRTRRRRS